VTSDAVMRQGAAILSQAGISDGLREAGILWRATPDEDQTAFMAKINARAARRPLSHVLGYRDFYNHRFIVNGDVLDPRPDTETLVDAALRVPFTRVLDLGTGSGCILLSLLAEMPNATGVGTDISDDALTVAARNAGALGLDGRALLKRSDWFADVTGTFDLIVSNPPYIAADEMAGLQPEVRLFEPRGALTDEHDGQNAYRIITRQAGSFLAAGGRVLVEIGPTQAASVMQMMIDAGLIAVAVFADLNGRDRVVIGQKPLNLPQS